MSYVESSLAVVYGLLPTNYLRTLGLDQLSIGPGHSTFPFQPWQHFHLRCIFFAFFAKPSSSEFRSSANLAPTQKPCFSFLRAQELLAHLWIDFRTLHCSVLPIIVEE